jgi:hypothetical protein
MVSVPSRMDLCICIDVDFGLHVYNLTEIRRHMRYCIAFRNLGTYLQPAYRNKREFTFGWVPSSNASFDKSQYEFANVLYKLYNVKQTVSFSVSGVTHDGA